MISPVTMTALVGATAAAVGAIAVFKVSDLEISICGKAIPTRAMKVLYLEAVRVNALEVKSRSTREGLLKLG